MDKKLFYVIDDGDSSILLHPEAVMTHIGSYSNEHNDTTPKDELPVFTVSPVFLTQEEYDNMPEY